VHNDVSVLLKDGLQSPTHPIVAAGDEGKGWTVQGRLLHRASSSVARLAWRRISALAS
jgi:hypothetical protein